MSNAPYLIPKAREGYRLGNGELVDSMINDGLWCAFENYHMGCTGEVVAEKYSVGRTEQDEYALNSHKKAAAAAKAGKFRDEIVAVEIKQRKGPSIVFDADETIREDTSMEALGKLKPAFEKEGTVTAGNAPGVNDGASAVVVTSLERARALGVEPMARIVAQATSTQARDDGAGRSSSETSEEDWLVDKRGGSGRVERSIFGAGVSRCSRVGPGC